MIDRLRTTASIVFGSAAKSLRTSPAVYCEILRAAASISRTRSCQRLGGTDRLVGDALPKRIVKGTRGQEVNSGFEKLFQVFLQPHNCEVTGGPLELYQEIDVTLRSGLVAGHGSKEDETDDTKTSQLLSVSPENSQYIVASHKRITTRHYPRNPVIVPQRTKNSGPRAEFETTHP